MQPTKRNIARLFNVIDNSLFMVTGSLGYDRITSAIVDLSDLVNHYDGETMDIWGIGEFGTCCLSDFIVGAYWHYTEWHGGQYSESYVALCALGRVFSPGMSGPEEENEAYQALNTMAEQQVQQATTTQY